MNDADLRSRRAAALEESGDVGLSEYIDKAAGERIARWPGPRAIGPKPPAASGSAVRRSIASCGGWVANPSASRAPMSRANSNSSRAASSASSKTGKGKVAEPVTDKGAVSAGTVGEETVSLARIDRLRNSMRGKDAVIDELIDLFVADLPKRLGAITHAVERADAPALALQAHALRGGAANFGASRLDELCAKLEEAGARGTLAKAPAMLHEVGRESARVLDALMALKSERSIELGAVPRLPSLARLVR